MEIINRKKKKKKNTINKFEIALKNWTLSTQTWKEQQLTQFSSCNIAKRESTWLITVESTFSFGPLVQTAEFYKIMTRSSKGLEYSKKKKERNPAELPVEDTSRRI